MSPNFLMSSSIFSIYNSSWILEHLQRTNGSAVYEHMCQIPCIVEATYLSHITITILLTCQLANPPNTLHHHAPHNLSQHATSHFLLVFFFLHCITHWSPPCLWQEDSKNPTKTYHQPKNPVTQKLVLSSSTHQNWTEHATQHHCQPRHRQC